MLGWFYYEERAFDEARAMELFKVLVQSSRAQELAERKWHELLPKHSWVVRRWIVGQCKLPAGATAGCLSSAGPNQLTLELRGVKPATEACITIGTSSLEDDEELCARVALKKVEAIGNGPNPKPKKEHNQRKPALGCREEDCDNDWDENIEDIEEWEAGYLVKRSSW